MKEPCWETMLGNTELEVLPVLETLGTNLIECLDLYPRSKGKSLVDFKNDRI